jgi:hypothetical protein
MYHMIPDNRKCPLARNYHSVRAEPRHMHSGVINDLRQAWCAEPCLRVHSGVCAGDKEADLELAALWANDGRDKQRKKQSVDDVTALRDGEDLQSCAGLDWALITRRMRYTLVVQTRQARSAD